MKNFTKLLNQIRETHKGVFTLLLCLTAMLFASTSSAQTLFSQDFSSSSTLSNYISATPSTGQFDAITATSPSTATITSNALRFVRSTGTTSFTRSTNFSSIPTALIYKFDLTVAPPPGGNVGSVATWQVGSGYSTATNGVETDANTYAQFALDYRNSNIRFNDTNGSNSSNVTPGSAITMTWVMNNSGAIISYISPSGTTVTVANDRMDLWSGTTLLFDDNTVQTASGTISDMKFAFTSSTGTITMDNISIQALITPQASVFSGNTICNGGTGQLTITTSAGTDPFTVIYNDGTANRTATNVSSGVAFNVFTNPTVTTNYTLISVAEASGAIRTTGFTDSAATVTVNAPIVGVGAALTAICQAGTSAALGGTVVGSATGGIWSDGGVNGIFNPNATTLNATWTAPANYSGSAVLTLTTSGGSCGTTNAGKTQVVNGQPTAISGGSQTICVGSTAIVSGMSSTNGTISWTENGAGSITAGGTTLTPTYTSAAGDSGNTVTLIMTVANSPCAAATANYSVVVNPLATVNANADQTICATTPNVTLVGSIGGAATSATWSGGTGSFSPNNTTLNATYTPSTAEFLAGGNITLTLTTNDPAGPCNAVADSMIITIKLAPTASAGGTQTICPTATATVSGASASNGTISWTEDGIGSITAGGTTLTPTYTPSPADAGQTVTLTMTVTNSPCAIATATYTVIVSPAKPAAVGTITGSTSVCAGVTSLGYSVVAVTDATNYTWTLPSGWNIDSGQGSIAITATAGGAGSGNVTVVASNSCGSTNPQTVINIFPVNAANNTGYVTSSAKNDNGIQCNLTPTERRGFIKFPLTAIPTGATIVSSSLRLTNNNSLTLSGANNDVKPLGNTDPEAGTSTGSVLYNAIGAQNSGTNYSRTAWSNSGVITLALNATATSDIQSRFASLGYLAMGLARGGTSVYNFFGYSSGTNAPRLDVTYTAPRSLSVTVNPLTTIGSLTTSACDTYTWAENGQTYTTSGTYTNVVGCNTATLTLTITPSTSVGSLTASACDTYTWAENGQTYTTSGTYTNVVGCNTATLTLTITPSTTVGSLTTSACDTYTWAENGQTYTTSGIYTNVVGCNTATLTLTIIPSTTVGSESVAACGTSYVWPLNGATYTANGDYTHVVGCNTATLSLTLTPNTTVGSESVTACGLSYVWAVNGVSYTSSGIYSYVVGCNTATLTLTLNTSPQTFYADTDGDGFGSGAAILSCTGQPANTSTNNTDCAPGDNSKWRMGNFFIDADNDGFNNGFPSAPVCYGATTPIGFVGANNGVDCDEALATVNPNASEVLGNGIDDNCDGVTDEVTPTSNLIASSCGITLTNLANTLFAYDLATFVPQLGPIQGYRFRVTNGATVRTYDSATVGFNLMNLQGGATYGTTYTVEVSVKSGGYYRAYGSTCSINTPAVPNATFIVNPISGSTLNDISRTIFCQQVPTASGYRFRVMDGATLVGVYSSAVSRFSLVNLGISNIEFGTTYTIDVLLKFGNVWRPDTEYGPTAEITTPATPGTSRVIRPSCGNTIHALWTTIFAQQIIGAQGYKFVVTNDTQTREYITANPRFQLPLLAGGAAANTTYTIRVDVLRNSSYVEGTVLCDITTSPTASRQTNVALAIYEVKAYPNPYAESFKLDVNTSSEEQVGVKVYDMLGREVESREASVSTITNLEIGSQYLSGVYNIVVTQGDQVKTLRVIKR